MHAKKCIGSLLQHQVCVSHNVSKFGTTTTTVEKEEQTTGVSNYVGEEIVGVKVTFVMICELKYQQMDLIIKIISKQIILEGVFEQLISY